MEPRPVTPPHQKKSEEDVDLGQLFYKTGGVLNNIFSGFNRAITHLAHAFLGLLFFLRRNLIWLIIGAAAGLGFGLYQVSKFGHRYSSGITIKANFNSTRALYGSMEYFNSLISS